MSYLFSDQGGGMKLAVFGGTGRTGRLIVAQALAAGYKVKVLARDPDKLAPAFGLEFIKGDVLDGGRVMATLTGCDAAVIALGIVKGTPQEVCSRGTDLILQAAAKLGVRKVVAISSLGVGDSRQDLPWVFRIVAGLLLKKVLKDKAVQEERIQASSLDWTIVRPAALTDVPVSGTALTGPGRIAEVLPAGRVLKGRVSRAELAAFVFGALSNPAVSRGIWFLTD